MKLNKKYWRTLGVIILSLTALFLVFISGYGFGIKIGASTTPPNFIENSSENKPSTIDFAIFWQAWNKVTELYIGEAKPQDMIYGAISGMVAAVGDPYTVFLKPPDNEKLSQDLSGQFEGIGAELVMQNQQIVVISPIAGSPAEKAGLRAKDIIAEINGESTGEMSLNQAVDKIRGAAGTQVKLKVIRTNISDLLEFNITREKITVASVTYSVVDQGGKKIAILKLSQFGDDTLDLAKKYVVQMKSDQISGIILDLRNNPGGYLDSSISVSNLFLAKNKTVVIEVDKKGERREFKTTDNPAVESTPMVILVNGGSASAAEIVTGAMKDNNRAKIIGEKTFGKGSVQAIEPLFGKSALKVTIAKWLTPSGTEINGKGIVPDIEIKETAQEEKSGVDSQLEKAKTEILGLIKKL